MARTRGKKWIRGAVKHPGALHRQLGIPEGEKIPVSTLKWASHQPGKLGQRARFALNMRKIQTRRRSRARENPDTGTILLLIGGLAVVGIGAYFLFTSGQAGASPGATPGATPGTTAGATQGGQGSMTITGNNPPPGTTAGTPSDKAAANGVYTIAGPELTGNIGEFDNPQNLANSLKKQGWTNIQVQYYNTRGAQPTLTPVIPAGVLWVAVATWNGNDQMVFCHGFPCPYNSLGIGSNGIWALNGGSFVSNPLAAA